MDMILEVSDVRKAYAEGEVSREILQGVNLSIDKGEMVALLGKSGSGKSTLLNIISGIDSFDSGTISIAGNKIEKLSEKQRTLFRRKHLGFIFQFLI